MKTLLKTGLVAGALMMLAGCVYEPGYVRSDGYYADGGGAYYGTDDYDGGYYSAPGYYYGGGGYYDPYCCAWGPSLGVGFYYNNWGHRGWGGHGYHGGGWGHGGGGWGHGGNGWHGGSGNHGGSWGHSGHASPSHGGVHR
jgi:hypothetical protein